MNPFEKLIELAQQTKDDHAKLFKLALALTEAVNTRSNIELPAEVWDVFHELDDEVRSIKRSTFGQAVR